MSLVWFFVTLFLLHCIHFLDYHQSLVSSMSSGECDTCITKIPAIKRGISFNRFSTEQKPAVYSSRVNRIGRRELMIIQAYTDCVRARVGDDDVRTTVVVDIGCCHRTWSETSWISRSITEQCYALC